MVRSRGSVAKVAGMSPATDPSNWQDAIRFFNVLRCIPNFPTKVGLIKHLVHPKSNKAFRATFFPKLGINSYTDMVTSAIGPLTRGSS